jgi:hypothetical protein
MRSIVRPLLNFKSAAIPSQHWCYARPTYQRTVVPIAGLFVSKVDSTVPPHLLEELEALLGREMAVNLAPLGLEVDIPC